VSNGSSKPESKSPRGRGRVILGAGVVAVIITVVALALFFIPPWKKNGNGNDSRLPTPDECLRLEELKNVAMGLLENEKFAEADARFVELAEALPHEVLPVKNRAICVLVWYNMEGSAGVKPDTVREAVDAFAKREPNSSLVHLLRARWELRPDEKASFEERSGRLTQALNEYRQAAELAPEDPVPWADLYYATKSSDDQALLAESRAALRAAHRLAPGNVWLLKELLRAQAEAKDPELRETLLIAKERLGPVFELIRRRSPYDPSMFLESATKSLNDGEWSTVLSQVRNLTNVIASDDVVQGDDRRVRPHALEFADYQFSAEFQTQLAKATRVEPAGQAVSFQLAADEALSNLTNALALAVADFDLNGTPDLLVLREREIVVVGRSENTDPWSEISRREIPAGYSRLLAADLDDDEDRLAVSSKLEGELPPPEALKLDTEFAPIADVDLVLYGQSGVLLLRNVRDEGTGRRRLEPVEVDSELAPAGAVTGAVLVDFYHDGDLDLVLSTSEGVKCWTNQGNMKFGDLSKYSLLPPPGVSFTSLLAVDWDRDADIDVVTAGPEKGAAGVLENQRHGQFRWRPVDPSFAALEQSRELALLEADGNVSWDLASAGLKGAGVVLTATPLPGAVKQIRSEQLGSKRQDRVLAWDYDNDGHQDLSFWTEAGVEAFRGGSNGEFTAVPSLLPKTSHALRDCVASDLDRDGDLDLVLAGADGISIYINHGGNTNSWLGLRLRGARDESEKSNGRVNHVAVGSLVEVKAGKAYQAQVTGAQSLHFGLGSNKAEVVRIVWTNGLPQAVIKSEWDQVIFEKMVLKGSCPYLFTWTGERYEFFTDLLWAAPLGLQFGEGKLAPSRPWEYLKIPGERLVAKDGRYRLQITEELWEAAYFDQVELIAVDHPADVEIYSNEKVGPAEIAELKVHTVRSPKTPVAARDKHGRDVLDQVNRRDGVYFRGFDGRVMQGLTDEHYLELDLGKLAGAQQITLFLTGWIRPTDTSLNVGIGENPALKPPRPPFLLVPNSQGEWVEAMPYMGFPGGKTKTIAVDLSGLFPADDYRLRIATSAEIYWDEAFFTTDEEPAPTKLTPLALASANLHERGFSAAFPAQPNTPETYDYANVSTTPRWPPMRGKFTRYGDVRELLTATDDRHVVLGSGDEMTLEFELPLLLGEGRGEGLPPGWKRDFFIHNVGWDKDADLNTVYGQTVEPLPFSAMKSYPYGLDESYPDSPLHRRYLETYQTREQRPARFLRTLGE
jgi:tetratricopeptide (TPR) repeat protein